MSFDLFLQSFQNGVPAGFSRTFIEHAFGPYAQVREAERWVLRYPDGDRCELYIDNTKPVIDSFMITRPPASRAFWTAILELLRHTSSALYWPGGGAIIANTSVRYQLPPDMVRALGEPTLVTSAEQIIECIKQN